MVGLLVACIVWSEVAGWPFLRQPLERALARAAAAPVQLQGRVKLHLIWQPRQEVEHLHIASDPRFKAPHLLDAHHTTPRWPGAGVIHDLRGELQQDAGVWQFKISRAHIGSRRLQADLQFDQHSQPPRLTGTLTGPKLALADLGPAIGADKKRDGT